MKNVRNGLAITSKWKKSRQHKIESEDREALGTEDNEKIELEFTEKEFKMLLMPIVIGVIAVAIAVIALVYKMII